MRKLRSLLRSLYKRTKTNNKKNQTSKSTIELFNKFDKDNHLQLLVERSQFDALHSWEFGYLMLGVVNNAGIKDEELLSTRLSSGQKALHFIWYLDAQVTNGGFIQFYWNGYAKYLPAIIDGLRLIGDIQMLELVEKADREFKANIHLFIEQKKKDDWEPLYENLKKFDEYDSIYYATHDSMMELIEKYAREHPDDFVLFK